MSRRLYGELQVYPFLIYRLPLPEWSGPEAPSSLSLSKGSCFTVLERGSALLILYDRGETSF